MILGDIHSFNFNIIVLFIVNFIQLCSISYQEIICKLKVIYFNISKDDSNAFIIVIQRERVKSP